MATVSFTPQIMSAFNHKICDKLVDTKKLVQGLEFLVEFQIPMFSLSKFYFSLSQNALKSFFRKDNYVTLYFLCKSSSKAMLKSITPVSCSNPLKYFFLRAHRDTLFWYFWMCHPSKTSETSVMEKSTLPVCTGYFPVGQVLQKSGARARINKC